MHQFKIGPSQRSSLKLPIYLYVFLYQKNETLFKQIHHFLNFLFSPRAPIQVHIRIKEAVLCSNESQVLNFTLVRFSISFLHWRTYCQITHAYSIGAVILLKESMCA